MVSKKCSAVPSEVNNAQAYLDVAGVMLLTLDRSGKVTLINRRGCEILGWPESEIIGRDWFSSFLPPEHQSAVKVLFNNLMEGHLELSEYTENAIVCQDGTRRLIAWHNALLRDSDGEICGTLSSGEDITETRQAAEERKALEARVQQEQKLESLGILAGGIAHDFNNLLVAILGHAEMALSHMSPASPGRGNVIEVRKAAKRAAELTNQMLAYSGKGRFVIKSINLNEIITEMSHLLDASSEKRATLRYDLAPTLPPVEVDISQIRQVLMNLVINACEALADHKGVVSIATGHFEASEQYLTESFFQDQLSPGRYVYLEVSDTGCGMSPETRQKIFDPFFTTKSSGRGLGLAAVLGIVRGHNGAIRVYSEQGKGSSFKLLLPASDKPAEELEGRKHVPGPEWRGEGVVLVVDDEKAVCEIARQMLERRGFSVITCYSGAEAVQVFSEKSKEIAAVLLDMTMPGMNGEEVFRELRSRRADVKVVLTSGYNEQEATNRFAGKGLAGFIQKPFSMDTLIGAFYRMLG
jgi:PAS domain S-box-containing protein